MLRKLPAITQFALLLFTVACAGPADRSSNKKNDKFSDHIRATEFQTPEQELRAFHVPEGFEVSLFASEPDISKPINMEFDDRGRLWVTQSTEYPMAAAPGHGKDRLSILEDTDGDGKADKFIHFKDSLNIPIGLLPVHDGAIAFSIPNIYYFTDRDNDGRADRQKTMFGKFGYKDTHGMVSNMISGYDGWVHACHGFSNTSTVAGSDGDSVTMTSGHTFRFRPDGSHIEVTSRGRVNPFGYTYDEKGYLYSVDCHSKPIYQIINGGDYPGFGKREPGIGFAPEMMSYELGSTALSGLEYYIGEQFPEEYRNCFYSGDVVTCQINRNTVSFNGSTPVSKREADFLTSDDPWFRPVAITIGPDGALYVADFYNRIIGHYEVSLDHPGRDRVSGRIWRISYKKNQLQKKTDWSRATIDELIRGLDNRQLTTRLKIADRLVDVFGKQAIGPVGKLLGNSNTSPDAYIHALWILSRLNALPENILDSSAENSNSLIAVHALRIMGERKTLTEKQHAILTESLHDRDAHIRRAAAMLAGKFARPAYVGQLINLYLTTDSADTHLRYTALMSVRDNLKDKMITRSVLAQPWPPEKLEVLRKAMQDAPSAEGADFLLDYIGQHDLSPIQTMAIFEYIGRYLPASKLDAAIDLIKRKFPNDHETQFALFGTVKQGIAQSGSQPSPRMKQWGISLAGHFLKNVTDTTDTWMSRPLNSNVDYDDPWVTRWEAGPDFQMLFSERLGYAQTSALVSKPFVVPEKLTMNIFDYDIHNTTSRTGISKNVLRIRLKDNNQVIAEYRRNQKTKSRPEDIIAIDYSFNLGQWKGKKAYIEVVDSSATSTVGLGKIQPELLTVGVDASASIAERRLKAIETVVEFHDRDIAPALENLLRADYMNYRVRIAAASALMNIDAKTWSPLVMELFEDRNSTPILKKGLADALGQSASDKTFAVLANSLADNTAQVQTVAARVLASHPKGVGYLLDAMKSNKVPSYLLSEPAIAEQLEINSTPHQKKQLTELSGSRNLREERDRIIELRLRNFSASAATAEAGKSIFIQNCAACHSVKGSGGMIGPQLDGIGNWGASALAQKVLDPNRNISEAFRLYNIKLNNGKLLSGLYRRAEGETLVFADASGKEFTVANTDIAEKSPSRYTLMPDHFRNVIAEEDFSALLKYLTSLK